MCVCVYVYKAYLFNSGGDEFVTATWVHSYGGGRGRDNIEIGDQLSRKSKRRWLGSRRRHLYVICMHIYIYVDSYRYR